MPSLLTLPRELRDDIIFYVVFARRPAPTTVSEMEEQERQTVSGTSYGVTFPLADPSHYRPNAAPLLRACKQLYAETGNMLRRHPLHYELDVKVLDERFLVPTWTVLPTVSRNVDSVRAVFQTAGSYTTFDEDSKIARWPTSNLWRGADGDEVPYVWSFFELLKQFLGSGPVPPGSSRSSGHVTIGRLEIDCVDPDNDLLLPSDPKFYRHQDPVWPIYESTRETYYGPTKALRADRLAPKLYSLLNKLVGRCFEAELGNLFYTSIGTIMVKVNGEVFSKIDLSRELGRLDFFDSYGFEFWERRLAVWIKWYEDTMRKRHELGFTLVNPPEDWKERARARGESRWAGRV